MKKLGAVLFLAVALVVPALAEKPNMELIPKIGYLFTPEVTADVAGKDVSSSSESAFCTGIELFFDMDNNLFLGAGLMFGFNHKIDSNSDYKIGFSNMYAAVKYKFLVNGAEDDPFFLYPLFQLGFGYASWDYSGSITDYEVAGSLYWGAGVGAEFKNIVLEFIYGCDYATEKGDNINDRDLSYTAFRINLGYKFYI